MLLDNASVFATAESEPIVQPWKPEPLDHGQWPPDYAAVYAWRIQTLAALRNNPAMLASAKAYYATRPLEFIMHWLDTYDPRKASDRWMPFVFFSRQADTIRFFEDLRHDNENGLIEKCRDAGVTWLACGYSVHSFLFIPGDAIGWGSRKQELVDKIGDPSSIFEKMRLMLRRMPDIFLPRGWKWREHATFMKLINPENGATIVGETGDNIGRGGRTTIYFKDESAHYERPELIEGALGDNTNVQIDISSVNGLGNPFHRRREAGIEWEPGKDIAPGYTRVLIVDWRDHPAKTQEWYDRRKAKAEREGLQHIFAQEVDRNYSAAISNTIINLEWIEAAVDAHLYIPYLIRPPQDIPNRKLAGLDVADDGSDRNAMVLREWIIARSADEWGNMDVSETTQRAVTLCRDHPGIVVEYDNIGVGAGVRGEYNRLVRDNIIDPTKIRFVGWNAGSSVIYPYERLIPDDPESILNQDMFYNFKAQAWWSVRTRFYKTYQARMHGIVYDPEELISLDSRMPLLMSLKKELAQPRRAQSSNLRMLIEKKPPGTRSPNLADALVMAYFPVPEDNGVLIGGYR